MLNLTDLTGKNIIVAGASSGIGRDTAVMLSRLGAKVILIARSEERLKETLNMLDGEGHSYYCLDLADLAKIEECVKNIVRNQGMLDGLVYSAGFSIDLPLNIFKPDKIQSILQTNLCAFIEMVRCVTKKKHYNPGMRIVGISSVAAIAGNKGHIGYSASKAGMNGAVRCMAVELASKGICINTIAPANIKTPMISEWIETMKDTDTYKQIMGRQYLGFGETNDIAAAVAFLISPSARFITGICLPVDGGYTTC